MFLDLTIAIPVRNEEQMLEGCLLSIGADFAKKIVLIDSGSTDRTLAIAQQYGVEVVHFDWNGKFPKKRNWFLRTHTPTTRWVLFLDADEYLTDSFKKELYDTLPQSDKVGYWLKYTVYFMGKRLRGGYPLRKLALFQVGAGEYERINEDKWSQLDMEVHEHPVLVGPVGNIRNKIDHKDLRDVAHYIQKHNQYASWEVERIKQATGSEAALHRWTWKQKLKYRLMYTPLIGPAYFLGSFFLLGGFRDGVRGLTFAILKMSYFTQIYCRLKEGHKQHWQQG